MRYAPINITTSGDNVLVPGISSRMLRVLSYVITSDTAMTITWKSGSTPLSGAMNIPANTAIVVPFGPPSPYGIVGNLQANYNDDLVINTSTNGNLTGHMVYLEVAV